MHMFRLPFEPWSSSTEASTVEIMLPGSFSWMKFGSLWVDPVEDCGHPAGQPTVTLSCEVTSWTWEDSSLYWLKIKQIVSQVGCRISQQG